MKYFNNINIYMQSKNPFFNRNSDVQKSFKILLNLNEFGYSTSLSYWTGCSTLLKLE